MSIVTQVHLADIHFGAINPLEEYKILEEQFLAPLSYINFDILSIDGDLFDRKFSANSMVVSYAIQFVHNCAAICRAKNAALILISGTESHDASQLSLFYDLARDPTEEVFIVEHIKFIYTKGLKILCIPEEYGKGYAYYENFLKEQYDCVFMHGTFVGAVPGANMEDLDNKRSPIFSIQSFSGCKGPIISGHIHTGMCLANHMYYVSSPIRYKFGEEQPKGYAIVVLNTDTYQYTYDSMEIVSFRYDTIPIGALGTEDPDQMIKALTAMQANGISHIRLDCTGMPVWQQEILQKWVHENPNRGIKLYNTTRQTTDTTQITDGSVNTTDEILDKFKGMEFLLDETIDPQVKFFMYLQFNEGNSFITIERLKELLSK